MVEYTLRHLFTLALGSFQKQQPIQTCMFDPGRSIITDSCRNTGDHAVGGGAAERDVARVVVVGRHGRIFVFGLVLLLARAA